MDDFAILRHGGIRECSFVFEHKKILKKKVKELEFLISQKSFDIC